MFTDAIVSMMQGVREVIDCGVKLRWLRAATDLSQSEFAKAIGLSERSIVNWERSASIPSASSIRLIAHYIEVPHIELTDFLRDRRPLHTIPRQMRNWVDAPPLVPLSPEAAEALRSIIDMMSPKP